VSRFSTTSFTLTQFAKIICLSEKRKKQIITLRGYNAHFLNIKSRVSPSWVTYSECTVVHTQQSQSYTPICSHQQFEKKLRNTAPPIRTS